MGREQALKFQKPMPGLGSLPLPADQYGELSDTSIAVFVPVCSLAPRCDNNELNL